jgi:hypothetical protein
MEYLLVFSLNLRLMICNIGQHIRDLLIGEIKPITDQLRRPASCHIIHNIVDRLWRQPHRRVAKCGRDNRCKHLSGKPSSKPALPESRDRPSRR